MSWFKLTIAAVLAVLLAGTHWKSYVAGQSSVRAEYVAAQLKAEQAARDKERKLSAEKQKAEAAYVNEKRKAAVAAADAGRALDGLRGALAEREARPNSAACAGTPAGAGLERQLLSHCAATLVGLAAEADRLEALVVGLQGYVKNVCLKE